MGTPAELTDIDQDESEDLDTGATGELTIKPPEGATFELETVKTRRGLKSLGIVPILVWFDYEKAHEYYGNEGLLDILDGTSPRVSFQNIARRYASVGKTMDEIAQAQANFRPGKRSNSVSTPASRLGGTARRAAEKLGDKAESITKFLERVARGEVSSEELERVIGESEK